jgi:radical SAM enzyme (TIGR01210 family)
MEAYPAGAAARDRFVIERRPPRAVHDPWRAQGLHVEDERFANGAIACTATVFLTGRECPWRCVMCDLWQYTIDGDTPPGAIPAQLAAARAELDTLGERPSQIKLYNAGSFFDSRAVPIRDYPEIARVLPDVDRIIVESHPALVGPRTHAFQAALAEEAVARGRRRPPALEVAMGLETAHPTALDQINKRLTVDGFVRAAGRLRQYGAALRVFLLVSPPFVPRDEQDVWLLHSIDVTIASGATAISLIPTRAGNGALEALATEGLFIEPTLADLERSVTAALGHVRSHGSNLRVFADLWNLDRFASCPHCVNARRARLTSMNLEQRIHPPVACAHCDTAS